MNNELIYGDGFLMKIDKKSCENATKGNNSLKQGRHTYQLYWRN